MEKMAFCFVLIKRSKFYQLIISLVYMVDMVYTKNIIYRSVGEYGE